MRSRCCRCCVQSSGDMLAEAITSPRSRGEVGIRAQRGFRGEGQTRGVWAERRPAKGPPPPPPPPTRGGGGGKGRGGGAENLFPSPGLKKVCRGAVSAG